MVDKIPGVPSSTAASAAQNTRQNQAAASAYGQAAASGASFAEALDAQTRSTLRFSAHAQERLRSRDIELSAQDQADLAKAVEIAGSKGAQESLILFDDLALIVSVRNKVVITALERGEEQANVFTHIDSAVVLPRSRVDTAA